ncbi:MAG: sulfotransferase [Deltaproteobacteria bacterium]|nr:sulfotransferase [Deltaproteobacteria bacterium]MBW2498065.1 sulfotransferase [Deltaproteobacteria bacterium]
MSAKDFLAASARPLSPGLQHRLGIWPKAFCLISGAPRSGATAVARWLGEHPRIALCIESRTLFAAHRFLGEVRRFEALAKCEGELARGARRMVKDHCRGKRPLLGRRALIDEEPLEPIALPDGQFDAFLADVRRRLPNAMLLFLVRDPVASVYSMVRCDWGVSLADADPRRFSLAEHVETWCRAVDAIFSDVEDPDA